LILMRSTCLAGSARWSTPLVLAIVAAFFLHGCARSGPEMARVTGKVIYDGKPVPKGTISFLAVGPGGRNATGTLAPDGSYTLQTEQPGDGAQLGEYRVAISARDDTVLDYIPEKPVPPKRLIPEKYENPSTSELKATVVSGRNEIPFELK
jgi:hypothetical protein